MASLTILKAADGFVYLTINDMSVKAMHAGNRIRACFGQVVSQRKT
jgi:hypothetical protein